mgnify:CR=1 FL=1
MIQRATRKRLKIRNLTRNPDFSVRLSIFRVFRSCSNQNTRSTFLYFIFYIEKDTKPVKKQRENRSWVQWAMLARPTIFFPLLLGWVQFLSFLILMISRRLDRLQFKPEFPFSSEFLEKFSAHVQIRTSRSTFLFLFLYFMARKNRIQSWLR